MMDKLFSPPVAFIIYMLLVGVLYLIGQFLAGSPLQVTSTSHYTGGETFQDNDDVPGYQPFYGVALFFAVLHLGVIVLATSDFSVMSLVFLSGLILILLAIINE